MIQKAEHHKRWRVGRFQFGWNFYLHAEGIETGRRVVVQPFFVMDLKRRKPLDPEWVKEKEAVERYIAEQDQQRDKPVAQWVDPELERLLDEMSDEEKAENEDYARRMGW